MALSILSSALHFDSMESIYLDHNATTPVLPEVIEAMRPFWHEDFGNPASAHRFGRHARHALESARERIGALLSAHPDEVVFTSGGTEANNMAIFGLAGPSPGCVIVSPIEHPSVSEAVSELHKRGFTRELLSVDSEGSVNAEHFGSSLSEDPQLAAIMLANNETGVIQPIRELAQMGRERTLAAFHCDAVQAVGKMPVSFHDLGVTTLSLSAHKFNGPKGIGALLIQRGVSLRPLQWGGHQQQGRRPGTEAVALAVGLSIALEIACNEMAVRRQKVIDFRLAFLKELTENAAPVVVNGPQSDGMPHTLNLSFPGCRADVLLMKLDLAGIACSTGSACSSGSLLPSPVLQAMGCPPEVLHSALRFSLSHLHTHRDIEEAARRVAESVRQIREIGSDE